VSAQTIAAANAAVEHYYELVDSGDVEGLLGLFAPDAVYHRPGYPPLNGRAELKKFYSGDRVIAEGKHSLHTLVATGETVAAHGEFAGILKDGSSVHLRFADFFAVGEDGRFARRDTFFFSPMV
jgi:ketosteroid isomerase-like protein